MSAAELAEIAGFFPDPGIDEDRVLFDAVIPPGRPWSGIIERGHCLRIIDLEGRQAVDFLCYNAERPEERYHAPNTIKAAGTLRLGCGHTLYSDEARPLFRIVEDTVGGHDTVGGCCSAPSNRLLYGVENRPGCRENFLEALAYHDLGRRDIVPNVNFFCRVPVGRDERLADTVFVEGHSRPGDYVELRAEMRTLAILSNCPQTLNPCNDGRPKHIRIVVHEPLSRPPAGRVQRRAAAG